MTTKWTKYTSVCPSCDALDEYTTTLSPLYLTCNCGTIMTYLSAQDVTIQPTETKEENMESATTTIADTSSQESMAMHYNNHATMIVKDTTSGELKYTSVTPYDVNVLTTDNHYYKQTNKKFISSFDDVKAIILDSYADSDDQETLRAIAEALDMRLTKTVNWTATMYVSGAIEVDLLDDFDLESELTEQLQVSAWSGDVEVEDYSVEDVREN